MFAKPPTMTGAGYFSNSLAEYFPAESSGSRIGQSAVKSGRHWPSTQVYGSTCVATQFAFTHAVVPVVPPVMSPLPPVGMPAVPPLPTSVAPPVPIVLAPTSESVRPLPLHAAASARVTPMMTVETRVQLRRMRSGVSESRRVVISSSRRSGLRRLLPSRRSISKVTPLTLPVYSPVLPSL